MNNQLPKRKKLRLSCYDYQSNGAYFLTICIKERKQILSKIVGERSALPKTQPYIQLTQIGKTVDTAINSINNHYPCVFVDCYCIMPNHIHIIFFIDKTISGSAMRSPTIATIVNQMKGFVSKQIGFSIWQKSYFDHIIRNEQELYEIRKYIEQNPIKWEFDEYYYLQQS